MDLAIGYRQAPRRWLAAAVAIALLVPIIAPAASAAPPPRTVAIIAVFNPITFGDVTFVNGRLVGTGQGGQPVVLEQSPPPFTDWTPLAQTTSDTSGYYSFELQPDQTMRYRASAQGTPSKAVQISVTPRITLKAAPVGTSSVRFSGTFGPSRPTEAVMIQRRSSTGAWTTIGTSGLLNGTSFSGRIRAHYRITLRAVSMATDLHLFGRSNTVTVMPRWKPAPDRQAPKQRR